MNANASLLDPRQPPRAIAMWDFSWLERRWPGAGYEDPGRALDELAERGYDAVRIDAYPHLVAVDAERTWELLPEWSTNDWGAPLRCRVQVWPALAEFVAAARDRGIAVALSTWFRQDTGNHRLDLPTPAALAAAWNAVLDRLADAGLTDALLYVDLCNEWPNDVWTPFYRPAADGHPRAWVSPDSQRWITESTSRVRARHPGIPLTVSFSHDPRHPVTDSRPVGIDFAEPHLWVATAGEFYSTLDYTYQRFDLAGYDRLACRAERLYRSDPDHWLGQVRRAIADHARWSVETGLPLVTTEGWGPVDWKDGPLLDWGWVLETCAAGVEAAIATGRWRALCTSNFCGPQFRGMWREIEWHRRLTRSIRETRAP